MRRQTNINGEFAAEGWFVSNGHGGELVFKNGGTARFASFVGYSTRSGIAAALLANASSLYSTTAIGMHLVNAEFPLPVLRRQAPIDPAKLAPYVGRYALAPHTVLTVTSEEEWLVVARLGLFFPESDTLVFSRTLNLQVTFELAPDGTPSALVLHADGRKRRAARLP